MRFIGRREGIAAELVERMEWAEATTAANERITLFVAFNYGGRAEIVDAARGFEGDDRGGVRAPPLRARDERPRPADPDQRRAADLELPALAVRLLGVRLPRRALARLHPRGVRGSLAEYERASGASVAMDRRATSRERVRRRARLDREQSPDRRTARQPPAAGSRRRERLAGRRAAAAEADVGDAGAVALGAAVGRVRGHDHRRRRRRLRGGDGRCSPRSASASCSRWRSDARPFAAVAIVAAAG